MQSAEEDSEAEHRPRQYGYLCENDEEKAHDKGKEIGRDYFLPAGKQHQNEKGLEDVGPGAKRQGRHYQIERKRHT